MKLVVVELPAKAKTIEKYLGAGYRVLASYGHVRDLPPKDGSVDPDEGFAMPVETYADKARQLKAIADEAKGAETLILATDPDREGEAISWHVQEVLAKKKALPAHVERVTFNAITKSAVPEAMAHPRGLDEDLIDAYRARRALDYLVGFTLSPVLWRKLPGAKSAGRVQSVALRLIVDREREIEIFRAQEYWSVSATSRRTGTEFAARLVRYNGEKIDRLTIGDKGDADGREGGGRGGAVHASSSVETKPFAGTRRRRSPPRPCSRRRRASSASRRATRCGSRRRSTRRARSPTCAPTACRWRPRRSAPRAARSPTATTPATCPTSRAIIRPRPRMRRKRTRRSGRPISAAPRAASGDHARLYELVWKRALASQMASARLERTTVELTDGAGRRVLRATGQVVLFPGFLALYEEGRDDEAEDEEGARMPALREGDAPAKKEVEASSISPSRRRVIPKRAWSSGWRSSASAAPPPTPSTLQTLKDREYVRVEKNRFFPEESGRLLTAFLERFFERYVSYDFTAELEDELDEISGGRLDWQAVLEKFWRDFKPKTGEVMEQKPSEITAALDEFLAPWLFPDKGDGSDPRLCPQCGEGRLGLRGGRFGAFVACSNYPECKFTRKFGQPGGEQARRRSGRSSGDGISLQDRPLRPLCPARRGKERRASIPKDVPVEDVRPRSPSGCCRCRARSARIPRPASRSPQHRPLRPLSRP